MLKSEKEAELGRLKDSFSQAEAAILIEYRGLKVSEITELRRKLTGNHTKLKVVKNRLAKLAIAGTAMEGLAPFFSGPVAVATAGKDAVIAAKILKEFAKDNERCKIKSGFLRPDRCLSVKEVEALALVPSKEESIARLMGSMLAPVRNMVGVFAAIPRQWLNVLNAVKTKKEAA